MFEWRNIFKGMMIGASDVVPGVSGGTIALLVGIYERLIEAINGVLTKEWKKHVIFLVPVGIGVGLAILTLSHLLSWLLEAFPQPTFFFFLGLILAIIPVLMVEADYKQTFGGIHYLLLLIAAIAVAATGLVGDEQAAIMTNLAWKDYLFLFFAGWLASSAMILPGISGSMVLLLLGAYVTVIDAIKSFNMPIIIIVGLGIVVGLLLTSKLIRYLFNHYRTATYAVVTGFVVGSIFVVYPGWPADGLLMVISIIALVCGYAAAYLLGKAERN
ncbi:undecaprenyl phosphate translocase family protein [Mesobacillus harenae]|uniref:undecaprenyl phosphate translocase family protein n=1 Tax=Mesobacillus harenae TaxID=2213203 RepID=UPI00158082DD